MNKMLEELVREFNPLHDFDNIRFYNHYETTLLADKVQAQAKNAAFFLTLVKPLGRGAVVFGALGAIVSYMSDNSPREGFTQGAIVGAYVDVKQYLIRGLYYYLKEQLNSSKG